MSRAACRPGTTPTGGNYPSAFPGVLPAGSRMGSSFGRPSSAEPGVLPGSRFFLAGAFLITFTSPCSVAGFKSCGLSAMRHLRPESTHAAEAPDAVLSPHGERARGRRGGGRGAQRPGRRAAPRAGGALGARAGAARRRGRGRADRAAVRESARAGHLDGGLPARADAARAPAQAADRPAALAARPALLPAHHRAAVPAARVRRARRPRADAGVLLRAGLPRARGAAGGDRAAPRGRRSDLAAGAPLHRGDGGPVRARATAAGLRRPLSQAGGALPRPRSEEHTSELQSLAYLVCRL